jgi:hypothetical protein
MARRNKLIMASVFEDTKTLQIYLLWNRQGHGKFMTVDYLQLDLAMSYLCSTFVLF